MPAYRIAIERTFAASHTLRLPDATYEPIHGHNWHVVVTLESQQLDALQTVMDFHPLEAALDAILKPWHNRHLNDVAPFAGEPPVWCATETLNPSAERVAEAIARALLPQLPNGVTLLEVSTTEAPGCRAMFRP